LSYPQYVIPKRKSLFDLNHCHVFKGDQILDPVYLLCFRLSSYFFIFTKIDFYLMPFDFISFHFFVDFFKFRVYTS